VHGGGLSSPLFCNSKYTENKTYIDSNSSPYSQCLPWIFKCQTSIRTVLFDVGRYYNYIPSIHLSVLW